MLDDIDAPEGQITAISAAVNYDGSLYADRAPLQFRPCLMWLMAAGLTG